MFFITDLNRSINIMGVFRLCKLSALLISVFLREAFFHNLISLISCKTKKHAHIFHFPYFSKRLKV